MNSVELAVSIGLAAWVGLLTLGLVLCVRQIAVLTSRLERSSGIRLADDGLPIGMSVPSGVVDVLPPDLSVVLLMSATCGPCRDVATELMDETDFPLTVLLPGGTEVAEPIAGLFAPEIRVIRDPFASDIARMLDITTTPFALAINDGFVVGKSPVNRRDDLTRLHEGVANITVDNESTVSGGAQ